ncbi:glycosyltransferase [Clostridium butyricum]|uniref:Glycosyltransferase n=1 Tax=Clostridium butyricum TaxID=1492 RepID=A0A6L9ESP8_CLOBU|nr:glycosyltransferase [Clostridium butyricum]
MKSVSAIIVTYNRKEMLLECINSLKNQSYSIDEIIIINNCSTDGTTDMLKEFKETLTIINLDKNIGGAGGFNNGIKYAYNKGYDLFWLMDDDTIPENNALEILLDEYAVLNENENIGFLASDVLWKDKKPCLMNIVTPLSVFNEFIERGNVKIQKATFVSLLLTKQAVKKCGLPIKEFFIWADDAEFTYRVSKVFDNYLIGKSKVIHKMNYNMNADIVKDNNRIERYYYEYRNKFYNRKKWGGKAVLLHLFDLLKTIVNIILKSDKNKLKKIGVLFKGTIAGVVFNPRIEYIE